MMEKPAVLYACEPDLPVSEFAQVLRESGLDAIRPVDDEARLQRMIAGAGLVMTARRNVEGKPLVGVARSVTDFSWCAYLSDLAVSSKAQGLGIGQGLIDATRRELGPEVSLMLASVPDAVGFYERIGMNRISDAFWHGRER
ncbi:GNAT family N-acetyltransferase [Nitratireductor aquimarinus]|uniref:GNAT family N-acetyltransferase n=1 Tax=Nitratireductor TaxID=245876 RepID=UPI0019D335B3|nr:MULTISPECIES: GNAT family N-acetyltransferase [Nitratireductor]MBY6021884.1 GNAT family N-acetyltransferase [Nitratireductor sp. DP7N14-4]MBN7757097.1 GNAT family N-acetyltransferase [Nitratireductor aquimarinus]MCV0350967.1 GNAT family N-acetyltransferase [Nitratireductor sp.]MCV0379592.1 GNAT family N-acetyltransferase [Nitratireductor sp.]MDJ1464237.1 GNAT family N-acetyltransferase [Nitratireductor sp. GZWM139]